MQDIVKFLNSVVKQPILNFQNLPKLSLPALAPVQVNIRTVTLHRNISGMHDSNS